METSIIAFQIPDVIVFYLSKSLTVIANLLYAVLFKHIVNCTLLLAIFNAFFRMKVKIINNYLGRILYWNILSSFMSNIWYCKCLLRLSGDIELNPGPKPNSCKIFSICHWNLNSITSHNFIKVSVLTAYNSIHKFDIICLSETYLNSETLELYTGRVCEMFVSLSDKAICKPLDMIFTSCLETGVFPIHWKKTNVVPKHKTESKQLESKRKKLET